MDKPKNSRSLIWITIILLFASVVINVALALRLEGMNHKLSKMATESILSIGTAVPDIEAKDLDGNSTSLDYSSSRSPTVIYVFSPSCKWCEKNSENVKELIRQKGNDFRFIGLSISNHEVREYVENHGMKFPILVDPTPETTIAYKLGSTPQTIVVSSDGKVLQRWSGAYFNTIQKDVENYFQIGLPGIPK